MPEITNLLESWNQGDSTALDRLLPLVYGELRRIAGKRFADEKSGHTLQPTAVVNEAYMRLREFPDPKWESRAHFFGIAACEMRRILIDHARHRKAKKCGAGMMTFSLLEADKPIPPDSDWIDLDRALSKLAAADAELSRLVELRYFGGSTIPETAKVMGISVAEVKRQWPAARAFLLREMRGDWKRTGRE